MKIFPEYKVGAIRLNVISKQDIIAYLKDNLNKVNGYICVTNTRTANISDSDSNYAQIQNNSLLTIPDGMPLVWLGKTNGFKNIERTAGPEIFKEILESGDLAFKHFLLGDTPEVLQSLTDKCINEYKVNVAGAYSPDFLPVDKYDYKSIAEMINNSGANIVWIALGSPKQDIFASKLVPFLDHKICMNVGAAFRFVLGEYKMPSKTLQNIGLTGIYFRLFNRPKMLLKYPKYVVFIIKNMLIR